jgi:hypothetical protein
MSALNAIDRICPQAAGESVEAYQQANEVRFELAELFHAARAGQSMDAGNGPAAIYFSPAKAERLRAALARVGGAE